MTLAAVAVFLVGLLPWESTGLSCLVRDWIAGYTR
jgi:hypothetical protein